VADFSRAPVATPVPLASVCAALGLPVAGGEVTGVTLDSRAVQPGDLYAALPGALTHGARFVPQAVADGASAILTDPAGAALAGECGVPLLVVPDPRGVLGEVSVLVYGHPARALRTFGVTGTNGKTTVTYMLAAALEHLGYPTGLIGTTGTWVSGRRLPTARTTPEAPDVQALMALMVGEGMQALAMEVSSHALVLGRVDGVVFDVAAFTNLSPDHLDFHQTLQEYFEAKAHLFTPGRSVRAVINTDDDWGRLLAARTTVPHTTYALDGPADLRATTIEAGARGARFTIVAGQRQVPAEIAAPGVFNVANALAAVAMMVAAGHDLAAAAGALGAFRGVPGRMEVVDSGPREPAVIVDYAHTPDAVERALQAVRPLTQGRIWCVLGCGGDRDPAKRPVMGRIAAGVADHLIVTDDNPRSEDPAAIRAAVLDGARQVVGADVVEVGDRAQAIRRAVAAAAATDTVMILGKGHETGQEVAGVVHPFDDRLVAAAELEARR
jgi:UDP-N-acetylmuramoyl-L-alanyl-D-glutamate--2,6-diaminopimelate ligase